MSWPPAWLWPVLLELELEDAFCVAEEPSVVLATVTGALAFAGADAETDAFESVPVA